MTDIAPGTRLTSSSAASTSAARSQFPGMWTSSDTLIALLALVGILVHLVLRFLSGLTRVPTSAPLVAVLFIGGVPLVFNLLRRGLRGEFGSDQLAGVSIIASVLLDEYLAGAIVVLMLSGGNTLERFAVAQATSVLRALARRVPTIGHRRHGTGFEDVRVSEIAVGDELSILPHEVCPVDGEVMQGHGTMDESYLTGEPFTISKGPGALVLSGAINGESFLAIRATRVAADSRYARIARRKSNAWPMRSRSRRSTQRPHLKKRSRSCGEKLSTPKRCSSATGSMTRRR